MKKFSYTIKDEQGIHARPAGLLVKCAKACSSTVCLSKEEKTVDATRLMGLMGMAVKQGQTVTITVEGAKEEEELQLIYKLFKENF